MEFLRTLILLHYQIAADLLSRYEQPTEYVFKFSDDDYETDDFKISIGDVLRLLNCTDIDFGGNLSRIVLPGRFTHTFPVVLPPDRLTKRRHRVSIRRPQGFYGIKQWPIRATEDPLESIVDRYIW